MQAYTFNSAGEFLYVIDVHEDPMMPGRYLLPRQSTLIAPPEIPPLKKARFNGAEWELINAPEGLV